MRSEGLVIHVKLLGVGVQVSANWVEDFSCHPCSPPEASLGFMGSMLGSDQVLFDGGGICRTRSLLSPSVQQPLGCCLGLSEVAGSPVVLPRRRSRRSSSSASLHRSRRLASKSHSRVANTL
jgi:hypothetical protein